MLGDDVEIGANTTIDRGALADTVIERGVRLDNLIHIAHNCRVGARTAMAACVGVAGSTSIGANCMIGGAAMISGHLKIGDRVHISGGTLVAKTWTNLASTPPCTRWPPIKSGWATPRMCVSWASWRRASSSWKPVWLLPTPPTPLHQGTPMSEFATLIDLRAILAAAAPLPVLLVDRVTELEVGKRIVALKTSPSTSRFCRPL